MAKRYPFDLNSLVNLVNLLCGNVPATLTSAVIEEEDHYTCKICYKLFLDVGCRFTECTGTNPERNSLWQHLIDHLPIRECCYLFCMAEDEHYDGLIGGEMLLSPVGENERDMMFPLVATTVMSIFHKVNLLADKSFRTR